MNPLNYFAEDIANGKKLCLLPIGRNLLEEPTELLPGVIAYPPGFFSKNPLRVVSWPDRDYAEAMRRGREENLPWFQSAATRITLESFLASTLICVSIDVDWDEFVEPESHEWHLDLIRRASEKAEHAMDMVRFHCCKLDLEDTLPGRVGFLDSHGYSCAQFFDSENLESYIIGGDIIKHNIVCGIGLDMNDVSPHPPLGEGEVGNMARQALHMFSQALEANSLTSKFVQCISILEYLAEPRKYMNMEPVSKMISRHVARDRAEYDVIARDFEYLTSKKDENNAQIGLRTNIVHIGKRLEELVRTHEDRRIIFRLIQRYIGKTLSDFIENSNNDWDAIENLRHNACVRLGLIRGGQ